MVTNEAETAARITQMMAVPKGNGHDRWQEVAGGGEGEACWGSRAGKQAGRHDGVLGVLHTGRA